MTVEVYPLFQNYATLGIRTGSIQVNWRFGAILVSLYQTLFGSQVELYSIDLSSLLVLLFWDSLTHHRHIKCVCNISVPLNF
jgi:hypothetical protein